MTPAETQRVMAVAQIAETQSWLLDIEALADYPAGVLDGLTVHQLKGIWTQVFNREHVARLLQLGAQVTADVVSVVVAKHIGNITSAITQDLELDGWIVHLIQAAPVFTNEQLVQLEEVLCRVMVVPAHCAEMMKRIQQIQRKSQKFKADRMTSSAPSVGGGGGGNEGSSGGGSGGGDEGGAQKRRR